MSKPRINTLDQFVTYVEARPKRLGCWRGGEDQRHSTLAWLIRHAMAEVQRVSVETGPEVAIALLASANHNQVGIASAWIAEHMAGPTLRSVVTEADRLALFNTAGGYWALQNAVAEVRAGARTFTATGSWVRMGYRSNSQIDALDRMLDLVERMHEVDTAPLAPDKSIGRWLGSNRTVPWDSLPQRILDELRAYAARILAGLPRYLPERGRVAGISTSIFDAFWEELLARGLHLTLLAWLGADDPNVIAPRIAKTQFVDSIARALAAPPDEVARIAEILSLDTEKCSDPALTPLVPLGTDLVPMSVSIVHASPHRNFLSIVQRNPSLFGDAGRWLGLAGERETASLLKRLDHQSCLATRVKVFRTDGMPAGDLDVVVCDPHARLIAAFEVRWSISSDGNEEVYRVESGAIAKRSQVVNLREAIESGSASPRWPKDWPDTADFTWRWFLLTRDVLPTKEVDANGVTIRSVQLLKYTLKRGARLAELLSLLDSPPSPPAQLCGTHWSTFRYGEVKVEVELINA